MITLLKTIALNLQYKKAVNQQFKLKAKHILSVINHIVILLNYYLSKIIF